MSGQRYERVSNNDNAPASTSPHSPPPSFRSRTSSLDRRNTVDQTVADAFNVDGSDDEEDNDGDDRQRLMRAAATPLQERAPETVGYVVGTDGTRRPPAAIERRVTTLPPSVPSSTGRVYGGGNQSDGVFANLNAKPESGEKIEEHPPTYEQAAADSAPPYWETTILAPGLGGPDDVYVDGLPVGTFFSFVWNAMISMSFQLVGFLLTYLLHTSHAAKNGSRAGLGVTLIQYGFYMKSSASGGNNAPNADAAPPADPNAHDFDPDTLNEVANAVGSDGLNGHEWIAYALMIAGWFVLIRAVSDFLRARRHEQLVLQSPSRTGTVPVIAEGEEAATVV